MARRFVVLALSLVLAAPFAVAALLPEPAFPADPTPGPTGADPAAEGVWLEPFEGHVPAISMVLIHDGRVLYWGGVEAGDHDNVFFLEDPHHADVAILGTSYDAAGVSVLPRPAGMGDLFCAGQTILPDGRVLTAGGSEWKHLGEDNTGFVDGEADTWTFDPATSQWTREPDMVAPRWYPTVMTLADGTALAASGIEHLPQPQTLNPRVETFDGAWTDTGADNLLPMYPRLFTLPSGDLKGDVFYATSATLWGPFGEHPAEATWSLEQVLDLDTATWSMLGPSVFGARQHANTVMLPLSADDGYAARIVTLGGSIGRSLVATNLVEMTTVGPDGISHDILAPLHHARWFPNTVILPDGKLLATGGGLWDNVYFHGQRSSPVLHAESFDPATGEWTQLAPMSVPRTYHSTALLLPDGRVLLGGHVPLPVPWKAFRDNLPHQSQIAETRFQIYEPPYLHWGVERPVITGLDASAGYGQPFTVQTPDAADVVDALLVRPGATTHAWDVSQRAVELDVVARGDGTLTFHAPPDADVATPGHWMLFLRTQAPQGLVPSEAGWIQLG